MKHFQLVLFLFIAFGVVACGPNNRKVTNHHVSYDTAAGLVRDHSYSPTIVMKRPNAPTLAAYNNFIIDPVQIDYTDAEMQQIDQNDIRRMQNYFRNAVENELRGAGYNITSMPSANTMRITFKLSGLKSPEHGGLKNVGAMAAGAVVGLPMVFAVSVGEVTVEGQFRESTTNRIDALVVNKSRGSRVMKAKPWSTWADIESAFDGWAEGIRLAVDSAHRN